MTIHRLLQNIPLEPEDIDRLVTAYEKALRALGLSDRGDPMTLIVAKAVIDIGQTGVRDPAQISAREILADNVKSGTKDRLVAITITNESGQELMTIPSADLLPAR